MDKKRACRLGQALDLRINVRLRMNMNLTVRTGINRAAGHGQ
jgi:hypothetical protein